MFFFFFQLQVFNVHMQFLCADQYPSNARTHVFYLSSITNPTIKLPKAYCTVKLESNLSTL